MLHSTMLPHNVKLKSKIDLELDQGKVSNEIDNDAFDFEVKYPQENTSFNAETPLSVSITILGTVFFVAALHGIHSGYSSSTLLSHSRQGNR